MLINIETTKVLGMTLSRRKGLWWWWHDRYVSRLGVGVRVGWKWWLWWWRWQVERQAGGWLMDSRLSLCFLSTVSGLKTSLKLVMMENWEYYWVITFPEKMKADIFFFQTKVERWGFLRWVLFDTPVFVFNTWPYNFITNNNVVVFDTNVTMNTIKTVSDIFCFVVIGTI